MFQGCIESDTVIFHMSELTPIYLPTVDGTNVTYSVFDDVIVSSLYKFYVLSIFDNYIRFVSDTVYGNIDEQYRAKHHVSMHIKDLVLHFMETKNIVDNNYEFVAKKILQYKEAEKLRITNEFETLNDQERQIQNELKNNRLGEKWGRGLASGLVRYDPTVYERERDEERDEGREGDDEVDAYIEDDEREVHDLSYLGDDDDGGEWDE